MNSAHPDQTHEPNATCQLLAEGLKYAGLAAGAAMRNAATAYDSLPREVRSTCSKQNAESLDGVAAWWRSAPLHLQHEHVAFSRLVDEALGAIDEFSLELVARQVMGCTCPVEVVM